MKTSLGIWAFGPMITRFVPGGYQPQHAGETTVDRAQRAVEGLEGLQRADLRWPAIGQARPTRRLSRRR